MPDLKSDLEQASLSLREALATARTGLIEREVLVELILLVAAAREHILVIGPPGTAKSEAVRRVARAMGGVYFEYLLGRFTEPSEIFGPIDIRKLKEGTVETETAGMLPEAEIAFLDEVFQGSTAILNTLLGILNERTFRRGHTRKVCPLRVCVGASNALPLDESLAAFADRFLVRVYVEPVPDPLLEDLLRGGWSIDRSEAPGVLRMGDLDTVAQAARGADFTALRPFLAEAIRILRGAGVHLSDRRAVRVQRLIAAAAAFAGRTVPSRADLWPLVFAVPTHEEQAVAREALRDLLAPSENPSLGSAAEEASLGPLARAARLVSAGAAILSERPAAEDVEANEGWRLRLEGVAREIDAGFAPEKRTPQLTELRERIVSIVSELGAHSATPP